MLGTRCLRLLSSRAEQTCLRGAQLSAPLLRDRHYHSTSPRLEESLVAPSGHDIQSIFTDTAPVTIQQAAAAELFFKLHLPLKSWTATEWRRQPHTDTAFLTPEVAFLGRSNSGKSSLLNGILLNPDLCRVGPKPGKTTTMHAWALSPHDAETKGARKGWKGDMEPKLTVLDMPGYGHGSRGDWGEEIMKYLTTRRQLRRAFVLVNPAHGLKKQDLQMLNLLRKHTIPHQVIATKCDHDSVKNLPELLFDIQSTIKSKFGSGKAGPVLMTINDILAVAGLGDGQANKRVKGANMHGLEDVRWAVLRAAGLEEYALSLLANNGLPPKKKSAQSVKGTLVDEINPNADTMAQAEIQSMTPRLDLALPFTPSTTTAKQPDTLVLPGSAPTSGVPSAPRIGIGITELMAMTTRSPNRPKAPRSTSEGRGESPDVSRRFQVGRPKIERGTSARKRFRGRLPQGQS